MHTVFQVKLDTSFIFSLSGTIKFNFSKLLNEFETCSLHWVCGAGAGVTMRPFAAPPAPCSRPAGSLVLATGGKWNHSISSAAASGLGSLQHSLFAPRSANQGGLRAVNGTSRNFIVPSELSTRRRSSRGLLRALWNFAKVRRQL